MTARGVLEKLRAALLRQFTPFDASRFKRSEVVEIAGVRMATASAEDILLTKLWWAKLGESERQINDAVGVLQVQRATLDFDYVERWVAALELDEQWRRAGTRRLAPRKSSTACSRAEDRT